MKNDNTRADVMIALMRARDKISDLQAIYSTLNKLADDYNAWAGNDNLTLNNKQCILALNDLAILTDIANGDVLADIDAMAGGYDYGADEEGEDDEDGWKEDWRKDEEEEEEEEEEDENTWLTNNWRLGEMPNNWLLDDNEDTWRFLELLEKFNKNGRE
jgi:ribosomal protein L12E/L44/L45/RPP1/RPP2